MLRRTPSIAILLPWLPSRREGSYDLKGPYDRLTPKHTIGLLLLYYAHINLVTKMSEDNPDARSEPSLFEFLV